MSKIQIGCNYHTKWQSNKRMRFVLGDVVGNKAKLYTRRTKRVFWTDLDDLIFIETKTNIDKFNRLRKEEKEKVYF